ncbi:MULTISPECIES: hypothetical protein [unclassified Modestobacter]
MSEQHRWLQRRLVSMARRMGFDPVPEHPPTRADVFVPEAATAIEVQLRLTEFESRSAARLAAGATTVLWMLAPEALPNGHQHHLFQRPAVRWRAVHRLTKAEVRPWEDGSTDRDARVQVYGTVAVAVGGSGTPALSTRPMDG